MAQTSINVQPVKGGSEQHNKREKELDYVRKELSHKNEYWEADTQSSRLAFLKQNAKEKTGRTMQAKATPIREGVVVIQESTTMQDLHRLADAYRRKFGIDAFQIAIHKDEGHQGSKQWKPNLHAHIVFDWTDHKTGKSIKLNRAQMVEMQTITAEVLGMERGVSSDKEHLGAVQFKVLQEEQKLQGAREALENTQELASKQQKQIKEGENTIERQKAEITQISGQIEALQQERKSIKQLPAAVVTIAKSIIGKKNQIIELEKQKALAEVQQERQDFSQEFNAKQQDIEKSKSELSMLISEAKAAQKEAEDFIEKLKRSRRGGMAPLTITQDDIDNFQESCPDEFNYFRCCLEARQYGMNNKEVRQLMAGKPVVLSKGKQIRPGLHLQEDIIAILKKTKEGVAVICAEFIKNGIRILDTFQNLISHLTDQKLSQYQQKIRNKGTGKGRGMKL